jgi:hypothetical protein
MSRFTVGSRRFTTSVEAGFSRSGASPRAHHRRTSKCDPANVPGDDFVVGLEHRAEAERFLSELKERFLKFGLELHSEKTRLIEFGRLAAQEREKRGEGRPETFDFLGFTHLCGKTRGGRSTVIRQTMDGLWPNDDRY